jgi:hypothetical protein
MTPEELAAAITSNLRADLHLATLEDADAVEVVLSYDGVVFCRAKASLPEPVAAVPPASCPHPHSTVDAVRMALLSVVAEFRRAAKAADARGYARRADAFYDAAAYIEDGKWPISRNAKETL